MQSPATTLIRACTRSSLYLLMALCYGFCVCAGNLGGGLTERVVLAQDRNVSFFMSGEQSLIPEGIRFRPEESTKNGTGFIPVLRLLLWATLYALCVRLLLLSPYDHLLPRQTDIRGLLPLPMAPPADTSPLPCAHGSVLFPAL